MSDKIYYVKSPEAVAWGHTAAAALSTKPPAPRQSLRGRCASSGPGFTHRLPILISPASSCERICLSVSISSERSTRVLEKESASLKGPPFGL